MKCHYVMLRIAYSYLLLHFKKRDIPIGERPWLAIKHFIARLFDTYIYETHVFFLLHYDYVGGAAAPLISYIVPKEEAPPNSVIPYRFP